MTNESMAPMKSFKLETERNMKKSRGTILSLLGGVVGALLLAAPAASAQSTVSTFTLQVAGTASSLKTGLPETVKFAGPVVITATFVGYLLSGLRGALAATVGIFLPPVLFVVIATPLLLRYREHPVLRGFIRGDVSAAS